MRVEARERRIAVNGLTLRVREWPADGPPIVLAHGLASNSRIWDDVAGRLAERHHVVALDQRGHGLSDRPTDGFTFDRVVGDLAGVIERSTSTARPWSATPGAATSSWRSPPPIPIACAAWCWWTAASSSFRRCPGRPGSRSGWTWRRRT